MATGDSPDFLRRVKRELPARWFSAVAPVRDAILGGLSDLGAWSYSLLQYAKQQTRIGTATGPWLDVIAKDYLGDTLTRGENSDDVFRQRIEATILQPRVTREGMISAIETLTGNAPQIFEPWNTGDAMGWDVAGGLDCGSYARPGFSKYGGAGGWGDTDFYVRPVVNGLQQFASTGGWDCSVGGWDQGAIQWIDASLMPVVLQTTEAPIFLNSQFFMKVYRSGFQGVPNISGWDTIGGGWDSGSFCFIEQGDIVGALTDAQIYEVINMTRPIGVIAWTQLHDGAPPKWFDVNALVTQHGDPISIAGPYKTTLFGGWDSPIGGWDSGAVQLVDNTLASILLSNAQTQDLTPGDWISVGNH